MSHRPLTCLSCSNHRVAGCTKSVGTWPSQALATCLWGCYEPGSDEVEDDPQVTRITRELGESLSKT